MLLLVDREISPVVVRGRGPIGGSCVGPWYTWPVRRRGAYIFLMFCMFIEGDNFTLPVSDVVLCLYLQWQSLTVDPKNLKTKLSAIRYLHERLGYVWIPPSERFMVHRCIMGLKRLCLTPVRRKLPITPALLIRMRLCPDIDWSTPVMIVVWGAMLIAFFCFLRKDNFTVGKADAFNTRRHLCRGDVVFGRSDNIHFPPLEDQSVPCARAPYKGCPDTRPSSRSSAGLSECFQGVPTS